MFIRLIAPIAFALAAALPAYAQADSTPPVEAPAAPETQVFQLPEGSRPHDAAPAPDGKIWYTAQRQGAIGIIDPASGEIRQVPLGEGSAPHGVIQGPDGAAWITDSGQNAIVRFDPVTEEVDVWPLPDHAADANLNTAAFDGDGVLWFTGQTGFYGRFDPATEEMEVWEDPE
ncbi:MAG: lyase, partial [Sphingomonadales bacterium]|nr:lyase [Sphingomonadales bacterium]